MTWHGKGNEDKRGQSVEINKAKTSWLYVAGQPVVCDRHMEVAALVSSINPAINATFDSIEVGALQQDLLWLLQDRGFLKHYPMALGILRSLKTALLTHCSKSSFFVQKFNFDFPKKLSIFFWVKNLLKCCGFGLFSC